jgi:hypothetical protein
VLQINLGNLQINGLLLASFIESVYESAGLLLITCVKAAALFVQGIEGVKNPIFAAEETVTLFHGSLSSSLS